MGHNFNLAMHVVAESILVSLLTSARGREAAAATRREGAWAACIVQMCKHVMSTDDQAVVAGQAGNWGVAVRMRRPPAARGPRKPRSLRGEESAPLRPKISTEKLFGFD